MKKVATLLGAPIQSNANQYNSAATYSIFTQLILASSCSNFPSLLINYTFIAEVIVQFNTTANYNLNDKHTSLTVSINVIFCKGGIYG